MRKRQPQPTSFYVWLKAGLLGAALAALIAFMIWNRQAPTPSPFTTVPAAPSSAPGADEEAQVRALRSKLTEAKDTKVKDAINAKDWPALKTLLSDPNLQEENLAQVLRALDLHMVDVKAEEELAKVLVDAWPTESGGKPRMRVLYVHVYSKFNLSQGLQKRLRKSMSKLKPAEAKGFLAEAFIGTVPYPKDIGTYLKTTILAAEPSVAREALYLAERIEDPVAQKKILGDLEGQFFKVTPAIRPYVAIAIMRDLAAFKKDPRSKAIIDYIRVQREDVWRDIQASVR